MDEADQAAFELITRVANPAESAGLAQPRAILLLWFLRNVHGIDDLEAYEYVCDGENDKGIDGLLYDIREGETDETSKDEYLFVF